MSKFFSLVILIFFIACNNNKADTAAAPPPPKYYYYPKANVYFDTVNKDYLFLGNDGNTWLTQKQIPAVMQSMMDKKIFIDSSSTPVWRDNENHKLVYSALLYASPNDTVAKKIVVQKANPDSAKKEKKGIAKFFDKLFGRKKKENLEEKKTQ